MLVWSRMVGPVPDEEFPAGHTAILGGVLCAAAHIEQAHLATPNRHLHSARFSSLAACNAL